MAKTEVFAPNALSQPTVVKFYIIPNLIGIYRLAIVCFAVVNTIVHYGQFAGCFVVRAFARYMKIGAKSFVKLESSTTFQFCSNGVFPTRCTIDKTTEIVDFQGRIVEYRNIRTKNAVAVRSVYGGKTTYEFCVPTGFALFALVK